MSCAVLAIRAVIGAAIREHGIALGDSRFGVDFNPSRNPRIADIKRRAADLIDAVETIAGENRPSEIARFKALTVTDIGAVAMWTAKAAAQSERRVTRLVTYRVVAPAPHVEVPHTTPAARLDRCPPRDSNPTRRCVAPRTKTASRHTPSTSSPRHAGRAKAPDAAARWRRPPGPQVTSTRPHPRRPRRPHAGSLAPVEAHRRSARRIAKSHPCTTTTSTPAKPPYARGTTPGTDHPTMPARDLRTALASVHSGESAPNADSAALMRTTARCALAMHPARSVRCSIGTSATTSCGSALS